ncbi:hypothetical protein [Streptomyces arenae]|uniref:hypothetical protein n=1 Tax=Streptomyces arenae TaxID=29301 RepID=UPI00265AEC58|nr:hypothetical protein [Streptomyces arenae]MCG7209400.1 hypothetical protein [Streptomyces arenae]
MPPEPEQTSSAPTDAEETTILDPVSRAPAPGGYGGRFAEDAFDYPSSTAHSFCADPAPTDTGEPSAARPVPAGHRSPRGRAVRSADGWRQAARRPRSVLTAAAALVVLGGFGLALSTVSDTVTSPPAPGSTVQVPVPKPPATQSLSPTAPATAAPPGDAPSPTAAPTQTSLPPGTGQDPDRSDEHGREDQGREDGDNADG